MEEEKLYMTIGIEELAPEVSSTFQNQLSQPDSDSERKIYSFILSEKMTYSNSQQRLQTYYW